jgi:hypothetical protein
MGGIGLAAAVVNVAFTVWGIHAYFKDQPNLTPEAKKARRFAVSICLLALILCGVWVWLSRLSEPSLIVTVVPWMLLFWFSSSNDLALELAEYMKRGPRDKHRHRPKHRC